MVPIDAPMNCKKEKRKYFKFFFFDKDKTLTQCNKKKALADDHAFKVREQNYSPL
jgi:hypothetical protein